jgi:opacity protein-like surface antigen
MKKHNWPKCIFGVKLNRMIFNVLITLSMLFSGNSLAGNGIDERLSEEVKIAEYQPYFSLGVSHNQDVDITNFEMKQQNLSKSLGFGLIKSLQLNNNWQVSKSIELNYLTTQFSGSFGAEQSNAFGNSRSFDVDGKYQEVALYGSVKVKKLHVFDNLSPYIAVSVGLINGKSRFSSPFDSRNDVQWKLGYKLSTGLEFNIGEGNSIAFGVGFTDDTDI